MMPVDAALAERVRAGNPIRVGLIGAGYMGSAIAQQIITSVPGLRLVAMASRTLEPCERALARAGVAATRCESEQDLAQAIADGRYAITTDVLAVCRAPDVDAIIEVTGHVDAGARAALTAILAGKHLIQMNAEVDATVGPLLKVYADRAGVVYTYADGDEPGVAMNLLRFVRSIGFRPVLMGQIKGFLDRYRNPETQARFAAEVGQKAVAIASYADGTKLALESTLMANATGFVPAIRGMRGLRCAHVKDLIEQFPAADYAEHGIVDYVLGAEPHSGAFVAGVCEDPHERARMKYFKMGEGPAYMFYQPFHLPHLQLPLSVARAVLFNDATLTPAGPPVCDTLTVAKRGLRAGEVLDGVGGFTCYGLIERHEVCAREKHLPIVLSEGCTLVRDVARDQPVTYDDVALPPTRFIDELRAEQMAHFKAHSAAEVRS